MANSFNIETFGLPRHPHCRVEDYVLPIEMLPGPQIIAGPPGSFHHKNMAVLISLNTLEMSAPEAAEAAAVSEWAAVVAKIDAELDSTPEVTAEKDAAGRLADAKEELEKAQANLAAANDRYTSALAGGDDPRPYRGDVERASAEAGDVAKWVASRRTAFDTASKAVGDRKRRLLTAASAAKRAEMVKAREKLQGRVETECKELGREMLRIAAIERLSKI